MECVSSAINFTLVEWPALHVSNESRKRSIWKAFPAFSIEIVKLTKATNSASSNENKARNGSMTWMSSGRKQPGKQRRIMGIVSRSITIAPTTRCKTDLEYNEIVIMLMREELYSCLISHSANCAPLFMIYSAIE